MSPRYNADNLAVSVMNPAVQIAVSPINSASGFRILLADVIRITKILSEFYGKRGPL